MIEYRIHENGWTVILEGNLKDVTPDDIKQISQLIAKHLVVIVRQQDLTITDQLKIIKMFKDPYSFDPDSLQDRYVDGCVVENSQGYILRVTARLDEYGKPGFAPKNGDAIWHCDNPIRPVRKDITWLYAVNGSAGSRTSWINNALSYADLDENLKDVIENLKCNMCDYTDKKPSKYHHTPCLVHTNIAGVKGLYFPFESISSIHNMQDTESKILLNKLKKHVVQEKYMYHHDWQDGDVVLAEQWLSIHQRWPTIDLENRLLYRTIFDYVHL
jgi:alpha-ketoglutarate-dependent taurine dioxygenase